MRKEIIGRLMKLEEPQLASQFAAAELSSRTYKKLTDIFRRMSRKELYTIVDTELLHCVDEGDIHGLIQRRAQKNPGYCVSDIKKPAVEAESSNPGTEESMPRAVSAEQRENIITQIGRMVAEGLTQEGVTQQILTEYKLPQTLATELYEVAVLSEGISCS